MLDIVTKSNRFSSHFNKSAEILKAKNEKENLGINGKYIFTYWIDTALEISFEENDYFFKLMRASDRNKYSDKSQITQIVKSYGIKNLFPKTYLTAKEASKDKDVKLWFAKVKTGTAGENMHCVRSEDLEKQEFDKSYIFQEQVRDIELIDNKKFVTRIYVFIWNKKLYLYEKAFNIIHGQDYEENSTDYNIQINHKGYNDPKKTVRLEQFSNYEKHGKYWDIISQSVKNLKPALKDMIEASSKIDYVILGIDCILQKNNSLKMIEINTAPNLIHTTEINNFVNTPFITNMMITMMGKTTRGLVEI